MSAVVGHLSRIVKTWKDTESDTKRGIEEMLPFCFKGFPPPVGSPEQADTVYLQNPCLPHFMPGLLAPPLAGRHARDAAEEPCEIVDVGDAAGCRNILHRQEGTA